MLSKLKKILYLLPPGDIFKLSLLLLMMLFAALLEIVGIGMIPVFATILATPETILEITWLKPLLTGFGIESEGDLLVFGSIFLIGLFLLKNTYLTLFGYIQARFVYSRLSSIGSNLFKSYMYAPYEFHLKRNTAELLRNITNETIHLTKGVLLPFMIIVKDMVLMAGIFIMLFLLEPLITFFVFAILGSGGALFLTFLRNKTRRYGKIAQNERGNMIRSVNEGLGGFKDARVLNREKWFYRRFSDNIKNFGKSQTFSDTAAVANKPFIESLAITGLLLIAIMLYWQGRAVESVIPVMILFGAATIRLMPAIQEIMKAFTNLRYFSFSIDPVYDDTLELEQEKKNLARPKKGSSRDTNKVRKLNLEDKILLEEVSYSYPNSDIQAVRNLSLVIPKGHAVGFVGPSGAGKTTLVDLILGLIKPKQGRIFADNIDINTALSAWQQNIGYIPQFIYLADDTIRRNIAFGLPDNEIDNKLIENALEAAQLNELVQSLPEGINTYIGERGTRLSGGQRQRIAIARALYHEPNVLIMDEATSALDNITERYVIDAIERLKGERTIIMIAHRLTTVEKCDHLFYMHKGKIADSGTYSELVRKNADFKKMAFLVD